MEHIIATIYEIQNYVGGDWEYLTSFPSQESAEECLHRTGPFEGLDPMITVDNPFWRIVRTEQIERSSVVLRVNAVMQDDQVVMPRWRPPTTEAINEFVDGLMAGGTTNITEDD